MNSPPHARTLCILCALAAAGTDAALAGELNPYNPPSLRQAAPIYQQQRQVQAPFAQEEFYAAFREDALHMTPAQRSELQAVFVKRLNVARSVEEEAHYQRLIGILGSLEREGQVRR